MLKNEIVSGQLASFVAGPDFEEIFLNSEIKEKRRQTNKYIIIFQ